MKKLIILLIAFGLMFSCDIGESDRPNFTLEIMSIQSVDIPDEFMLGETYEISMDYTRPNGCYEFSDFIYQVDFNERTVAVVDAVFTDVSCTQATEQATVSFDFRVTSSEDYVFRFYQGQVDGEDQYLVVEVPVVE